MIVSGTGSRSHGSAWERQCQSSERQPTRGIRTAWQRRRPGACLKG
ncbi:MAG: hypothetical protein GDA43_14880 [Hormoscilla sp. SP5CHS1]|nr:hypothetical protein [Hormoscilla sp. SP5CHS1]